ncbi:MAG: hypothetical protein OSA99_04135 [Acidimicrobiales bacterium]|nr:hypothetical protein [Acidimicrobiales bacterium]
MAIGAVWALGMAGLVVSSAPASGQAAVEPGRGSAYAQGYKIDPRSGRLSFALTYGMALAGHQNTVAVGEARSLDLGVIGTTLAGAGCDGGDPTLPKEDQPQPLVVRSGEDGAAEGKTETENGVEKQASADSSPLATSVATTAATGDRAAVLIGSTRSETSSGIVDGVRVARAVTDVSEISVAVDALVIKGLRWEASWQSAPQEKVTGSFTIEGIEIAGQAQPTSGDAFQDLAQANAALTPLGIEISPPTVRNESGISFVDPLRIGIVPSDARDGAVGGVIGVLQPVREALVDALIEFDCGNASYVTIADLALGSVTGAGSLNIELGGVTATSADLGATSLLGSLPPPPAPSAPALPDSSSGSVGTGGSTGSSAGGSSASGGSGAVTPVDAQPAASNTTETATTPLERIAGSRGGPLVLVGLGGLLLLGALAELDRRKMRKAQRSVPMEALV